MNKKEIAKRLGVSEDNLIWSEKCLNPETLYHHSDGTIKGDLGYYVVKKW